MEEKQTVCWAFQLGEWVHWDTHTDDAVWVIVWREVREGLWSIRQRYGIIDHDESDMDKDKLEIHVAEQLSLKPYKG